MPFIHRLQQGAENTRTGYLNVSVLGGNTANTEFEFLTGNTIGFLPQGSVAYQQYVQKETPSLAYYLKELDYHTVAIHPYYASGWDRDRVYPLLGFDEFLSQDDFTNPNGSVIISPMRVVLPRSSNCMRIKKRESLCLSLT